MWSVPRVAGSCFLMVLVVMPSAGAVSAGVVPGHGPWSPPVDGRVVRSFEPPVTRFGPGHLGVDFAAAPGTPVRAAGDGVVVFAGRVGQGLHVVVAHDGGVLTTVSFLATVAVLKGQVVGRGASLGTSGGTAAGHRADVLHFGVRIGANYVDPMLLFEPPDLTAVVHLASPRRGAMPPEETGDERAGLVDAMRVDARSASRPQAWWGAPGEGSRPAPRRWRRW